MKTRRSVHNVEDIGEIIETESNNSRIDDASLLSFLLSVVGVFAPIISVISLVVLHYVVPQDSFLNNKSLQLNKITKYLNMVVIVVWIIMAIVITIISIRANMAIVDIIKKMPNIK